jgi:glycosyltransferase involved in cell wall biosynthesis
MEAPPDPRPLRLGFVTPWDVADRAALSGMPAAVWAALGRQGVELVRLQPPSLAPLRAAPRRGGGRRALGAAFRALVPEARRWSVRRRARLLAQDLRRGALRRALLERARSRGERIGALLAEVELDGVLAFHASTELFALRTELPVVYVTDGTPRLLEQTYPDYARRGRAYHELRDRIERVALQRAAAVIVAAQGSLRSAVEDYGLARERAHLIPLGAGVVPDAALPADPQPPAARRVELALIAADPVRKRLDLCIDVAEILQRRGCDSRLHYIGPPTARAVRSPVVQALGRLRLDDDVDRRRHQDVLRRSHFLLLPSRGEMFGIAVAEAAHFGRPSLVSDTGGLPTVVEDGRTGLVLPLDATASDYADAIEALCADPARYRRLSAAALARAREVLNWDAWGAAASAVIRCVCGK